MKPHQREGDSFVIVRPELWAPERGLEAWLWRLRYAVTLLLWRLKR